MQKARGSGLIAVSEEDCGAGKRSRTPDLRITNALLYQLSYTGTSLRTEAERVIINSFHRFEKGRRAFPNIRINLSAL